jgi:AmiR/NasT family two-component response regulator
MPTRQPPSTRIAQAAQIIAKQLGCDDREAVRRLRERAEGLQYRVHNYARLVIEGMVRFDR